MLQGPNKLKNYRLRWLSKPLRLARFESLWIQVCSIVSVSGYRTIFLSLLLLSLSFLIEFSQWFCPNSLLPNALPMLAASSFYSVVLRFRGTTDSSLLFPWVPAPMSCQPLQWLVPSSFSHSFLLLMPFPQKLLADFPFWGVPRELTSNLSSFKAFTPHLFRFSFFVYLSFCHFFLSEPIPSLPTWKSSELLPFMVLPFGFPEVLAFCS